MRHIWRYKTKIEYLLIFFLLPLLITMWSFFNDRINVRNDPTSDNQVSVTIDEQPGLNYTIRRMLQVPLSLDSYQLCVRNDSYTIIDGKKTNWDAKVLFWSPIQRQSEFRVFDTVYAGTGTSTCHEINVFDRVVLTSVFKAPTTVARVQANVYADPPYVYLKLSDKIILAFITFVACSAVLKLLWDLWWIGFWKKIIKKEKV